MIFDTKEEAAEWAKQKWPGEEDKYVVFQGPFKDDKTWTIGVLCDYQIPNE